MAYRRASPWPGRVMALLTLGVVACVAGGGWYVTRPIGSSTATAFVDGSAGAPPATLRPDGDYYAFVKLIELRPTAGDGDSWELRGKSPPDIAFRLYWNGVPIFTGAEREDRLIAEWDLLRLDLKDAILTGQVEVASAVNAPIIRAAPGGLLTIEVWDEDATFNDEAGKFDLPAETLREGLNTFTPEGTGVARLVLDMVPRDLPLPDLLERASNR